MSKEAEQELVKEAKESELPVISYVTAPESLKLVRDNFLADEVTVARLGQVWAAFWRAHAKKPTEVVYSAKGRDRTKCFSVLGPVELLQAVIDWGKVQPLYVDLLRNKEMLIEAAADKLFLRFPISAETKKKLDIPDWVLTEETDEETGELFYIMHLISGQGADYGYLQEEICPADAVTPDEGNLKKFLNHHLVAITSWNKSGQGSNYDDFDQALELSKEIEVPLVIKQSPKRGKAYGSYGVIDIINYDASPLKEDSHKAKKSKTKKNKIVRQAAFEEGYWHGILKNFALCARKARDLAASPEPEALDSGL